MNTKYWPLLALIFTLGCASGQLSTLPKIENPDKAATITMIRPGDFYGGGLSQRIALDDQDIAMLKNKTHATFKVNPGNHSLSFLTMRPLIIGGGWALADRKEANFKSGDRYYVKIYNGTFEGPSLTFIEPEEAEKMLKETNPIELELSY